MGFRFRKSFGKGPFRVTVSKSGIGYSVGAKGLRYTKKAGGGTRTTASIPSTGISYITDSGSKKKGHSSSMDTNTIPSSSSNLSDSSGNRYCKHCYRILNPNSDVCPACGKSQQVPAIPEKETTKKPLYKRWWFLLIVGLILLRGCGAIINAEPTVQETQPPVTETNPIVTEAPTEASVASAFPIIVPQPETTTQTYVLNKGQKKFHKPGCSSVEDIKPENKSTFTGTRDEVIEQGYDPCGRCNP